MGAVEAILGVLALLTVALAGSGRRRDCDDLKAAMALMVGWIISASLRDAVRGGVLTADQVILANPVMDLATGLFIAAMFKARPARWKLAILMLLMGQMISHVAFGLSDTGHSSRYVYALWLNLSFIAQLACAGAPGANERTRDVGRSLRRRALSRSYGRAR